MSDLQGRITAGQTSETNFNKGPHYNLITGNIDPVFKSASLIRAWELSATRLGHQDWYTSASSAQHSMLQDANINLWTSQNNVDRLLEELQGIYEFAEPLLSAALKEQYGVDDDVKTTYLHLYIPKDRPWYVIDISGASSPGPFRYWMPPCTTSAPMKPAKPAPTSSASPMSAGCSISNRSNAR